MYAARVQHVEWPVLSLRAGGSQRENMCRRTRTQYQSRAPIERETLEPRVRVKEGIPGGDTWTRKVSSSLTREWGKCSDDQPSVENGGFFFEPQMRTMDRPTTFEKYVPSSNNKCLRAIKLTSEASVKIQALFRTNRDVAFGLFHYDHLFLPSFRKTFRLSRLLGPLSLLAPSPFLSSAAFNARLDTRAKWFPHGHRSVGGLSV
ncbi:hypothetical protein EDB89DRAFT_283547 [Lactarius sanguifluus]|nr:hypothetical protein EDB89DRAFT_283547 [Lactarius sanguifluus]